MSFSSRAPAGLILKPTDIRIWSITSTERMRRTLTKSGATPVTTETDALGDAEAVVAVRADWVIDPTLIKILATTPETVLVTKQGDLMTVLAGHVSRAKLDKLAAAVTAGPAAHPDLPENIQIVVHDPAAPSIYLKQLRKLLKPVVMELTPETVTAAENALYGGSYKGVTDCVTKFVWPLPARYVAKGCAALGITPNMVTMVGFILVFVAGWCFMTSHFWGGLAAAWVMTFLDTVDGKLARCTQNYSKFGDVFDHGIDLISPPFWWWYWHVGCLAAGVSYPHADLAIGVVIIGYVVLRIFEGLFKALFGMHIHVWRRFDSFFRLIVARRNPILVILTVAMLFGAPGWGMVVTAVWTAISVLVHLVQTLQAGVARRSSPIVSWMEKHD